MDSPKKKMSYECYNVRNARNVVDRYSSTRIKKTSMMWASQNFLLYKGTVIKIKGNEWRNNLKKYLTSVPLPHFGDTYNMYKL